MMNRFNSIILVLSVFIMANLLNANPTPPIVNNTPFSNPLNVTVKTIRVLDGYGLRNVGYYVTRANYVVTGNTVYGTLSELLAAAAAADNHTQPAKRAHSIFRTTGPDRPWPNARIPYKYANNAVKTALDSIVKEAIRTWTSVIPGLRIVEDPGATGAFIHITSNKNEGCYSSVGWRAGRVSQLNLEQPGCDTDVAVHEFGHALGLQHEHQRSDRDNFIRILCENIDLSKSVNAKGNPCPKRVGFCALTPTNCCGIECQFAKIQNQDSSGIYDFSSVMHYFSTAFGRNGIFPTLVPINPRNAIRLNAIPSPLDYKRVCDLYNRPCTIAVP